jgi:hypothetical protein
VMYDQAYKDKLLYIEKMKADALIEKLKLIIRTKRTRKCGAFTIIYR